jgi:hypothetical protein
MSFNDVEHIKVVACRLTLPRAGIKIDNSKAIIDITTSNSTRVKPCRGWHLDVLS